MGDVNLTWTAPAGVDPAAIAGYGVFRVAEGGSAYEKIADTSPLPAYTDAARPDGTYFYRIATRNVDGVYGAPSDNIEVVVKQPAAILPPPSDVAATVTY